MDDCSSIPEISYSEFGEIWSERFRGRRVPLKVTMELTERCNLQCVHCYIRRAASDKQAKDSEMAFQDVISILDQAAEVGTLWLLLTGGEPLLRSDFGDIYRHAKEKGFLVDIFTNGTLLTPQLADLLVKWPPRMVEITLYGATRETYESVTGVPGSYDRCLQGLELLAERGVKFGLKTVVMTLNLHEFELMKALADRFGVRFRYDPIVRPSLRSDRAVDLERLRIAPEQVVALEAAETEHRDTWTSLRERYGHVQETDLLYNCNAGIKLFHVDAYGQMSICMGSRMDTYDLLRGSVREGWEQWALQVRMQTFTTDFQCRHCDKAILCVRCPGAAALENGNPESVVPYLCEIAHRRAAEFWPLSGAPEG